MWSYILLLLIGSVHNEIIKNYALCDTHSELINEVLTKPEIKHDVPKFLQEKCSIKCISKGAGEANKGNQMFIEKQ